MFFSLLVSLTGTLMVVKSSSMIGCCALRWQDRDNLCRVSWRNGATYLYFGAQNKAIRYRVKATTTVTTEVRNCIWCVAVLPPEKGSHCSPRFKTPAIVPLDSSPHPRVENFFMLILKLLSHTCLHLRQGRKIILSRIKCFNHPPTQQPLWQKRRLWT
jgi:hypothetical protein